MASVPRSAPMETLKRWKDEGKIGFVEADPPKTSNDVRLASVKAAAERNRGWWGHSNGRPKRMAESGNANFKSIAAVLFPGKDPQRLNMGQINDVAHLIKHHSSKHEIFVTGNAEHFISAGKRETLKAYFGILVMTPDEAVMKLRDVQGWDRITRAPSRLSEAM